MSALTVFNFDSTTAIRTALVGEAVWFVAKDLADALEYASQDKAYQFCKNVNNAETALLNKINNLPPAAKWIPESDMYRLVMKSTKPEAEKFQDWVCEDVLPSIRKTGSYSSKPLSQLEMAMIQMQALIEVERSQVVLVAKVEVIESQVSELQVDLRNGVPHGYVSKANALRIYGSGLSKAIFEAVMTDYGVKTQAYVHYAEGHSVATFGYLENIIPEVIAHFISAAVQATTNQCFSDKLNKRFNYKKPTLQ